MKGISGIKVLNAISRISILHILNLGLVVFLPILLLSCASTNQKDNKALLAEHKYSNVSPEQILEAAEKAFRLTHEKDIFFSYSNKTTSLKVVKVTTPQPVDIFGLWRVLYHWNIVATDDHGLTKVITTISTKGTGGAATGYLMQYDSPDVIELFYTRLDYVLGLSKAYPSCDDYKQNNPESTSLDALCLFDPS